MAVVYKQRRTGLKGLKDFLMQKPDPIFVARCVVHIQAEGRVGLENNAFVIGERPDTELRPLQIHKNANGTAHLFLDFADISDTGCVVFMAAVAEVKSEDVGAGIPEVRNGFYIAGRGTQSGDNFSAAGA